MPLVRTKSIGTSTFGIPGTSSTTGLIVFHNQHGRNSFATTFTFGRSLFQTHWTIGPFRSRKPHPTGNGTGAHGTDGKSNRSFCTGHGGLIFGNRGLLLLGGGGGGGGGRSGIGGIGSIGMNGQVGGRGIRTRSVAVLTRHFIFHGQLSGAFHQHRIGCKSLGINKWERNTVRIQTIKHITC